MRQQPRKYDKLKTLRHADPSVLARRPLPTVTLSPGHPCSTGTSRDRLKVNACRKSLSQAFLTPGRMAVPCPSGSRMYCHEGTHVTLPGWLRHSSDAPSKREASDPVPVCVSLSTPVLSHLGLMGRLLRGHLGTSADTICSPCTRLSCSAQG